MKHHCFTHHTKKRPEFLNLAFILNALHASTNRHPATSGKGIMQPPHLVAAVAA
jgi:hypothetical protein